MFNWKSIMVGVLTMIIGLAVWELWIKKMVVTQSFERYYDYFDFNDNDDCGCGGTKNVTS